MTNQNPIPLNSVETPETVPEAELQFEQSRFVRNVIRSTLTPVLPDPAKATGAAVIVAPGGAFRMLSVDNEGFEVAQWLADRGITAFVLKYRLIQTPADDRAFMDELQRVLRNVRPGQGLETPAFALEDGKTALAMVRARAKEWHVDPHRVGFLGFSAGATLTLSMALLPEPAERPDFVAPIYGPMGAVDVPAHAPPLFAAIAADDQYFGNGNADLIQSWLAAKRPAELHIYFNGQHGFGMKKLTNSTAVHWIDEFYWWMNSSGFLIKQ